MVFQKIFLWGYAANTAAGGARGSGAGGRVSRMSRGVCRLDAPESHGERRTVRVGAFYIPT